ncbi:MAG TPA: hypothetical protein VFB89_09130 [Gemmatimonadales bacterium]|nr:hypothetical protein [Gemmatimonadales bacterium]
MGVSVDLIYEDLRCKSADDARKAAATIAADEWIHPYHLQVVPATRLHPGPGITPCLEVTHFKGDHWHDERARRVWLAIAPHLANGSTLEFEGEDSTRWRIRWEGSRVFEEHVTEVIWAVNEEITAPEAEKQS